MFDTKLKSKDGTFEVSVAGSEYEHQLTLVYEVEARKRVEAKLTREQASALRDALDRAIAVQDLVRERDAAKRKATDGINASFSAKIAKLVEGAS